MRRVLGIILGGGQGTRLYPLTKLRAKPAVPLAGKYRLIDIPISNCINSGIQKIYVLTQFNSASLNRHVSLTYHFSPFSEGFVEILAAQRTPERSDWFQGTADAVRQYLHSIKELDVNEYLILSGDHLYRMDYRPFVEYHRKNGADLTISGIPLPPENASDFGLMKIDAGGNILEFSEKPKGAALEAMRVDTTTLGLSAEEAKRKPFLASMGIYVFKRETLIELLTNYINHQDFGKEIIPNALGKYNVKAYLFNDYWEDIGTIGAFYQCNMSLTKYDKPNFSFYDVKAPIYTRQRFLPPCKIVNTEITESMVSEGCIIESAKIRRSVIGVRSYIAENVQIEDTLILGADYFESHEQRLHLLEKGRVPVGIGKNTIIKKAIVDKNARIGQNVKIINRDNITEVERDKDGFWIRDGIVIITKNATIPDNTII
ncbi:MAG TPA: glucose-1-phosphate adenylyltransferase [bacterium]|nr:glucose-1-phosphate adenylyltransferase [bacterium]HPN45779.1 glucose-1-phosphate adenylyltransferase [bacterium]